MNANVIVMNVDVMDSVVIITMNAGVIAWTDVNAMDIAQIHLAVVIAISVHVTVMVIVMTALAIVMVIVMMADAHAITIVHVMQIVLVIQIVLPTLQRLATAMLTAHVIRTGIVLAM